MSIHRPQGLSVLRGGARPQGLSVPRGGARPQGLRVGVRLIGPHITRLSPSLCQHVVTWQPSKDGERLIGRILLNKRMKDGSIADDTGALLGLKVRGGVRARVRARVMELGLELGFRVRL